MRTAVLHMFYRIASYMYIVQSIQINDVNTNFDVGPRSAVGNVSGYRCVSDCRSRGRYFDPGPVPYFCGE